MAQYDGSIRINTQINSKSASAQLMSLENRIVKTADKIASLRSKMDALKNAQVPTQAYKDLEKELSAAEKEFAKLKAQMDKPGKATDEYKSLQKDLEKAQKELDAFASRQKDMEEMGLNFGAAWNNIIQQTAYASDAVDSIKEKMYELERSGKAFQPRINPQNLEEARRKIEEIKQRMEELKSSGGAFVSGGETEEYTRLEQQLRYLESDYEVLIQRRNEFNQRHKVNTDSYKRLKKLLLSLAEVAKKAGKSIASSLKKATSSMFGFGKSTKSSNNMLQSGFKNILKYGLGIRSFYALVNKFRNAVKEGFSNLAQYSDPVNKSLSSLKSALTQLKNSLATAFAPILTAIAPALTTLINMVSKAATAVGMLIAALTGQKTFVKATAVQEDYAASLGGTAKAAKDANKQLSGLDKLNNLTSNDGGNGGGGGGGISPGDMFETVDISSQIGDLAKMIKEAWAKADFTEIGGLIGKKLKNALDNIPWGEIQSTAAKVGKSLATLINGFVETEGFGTSIGKSIAKAINTGIIGIESFAKNLHWNRVGNFISESINGILEHIEWDKALSAAKLVGWGIADVINNALTPETFSNVGKTIGNAINTVVAGAKNFFEKTNFTSLGKGAADMINEAMKTTNWEELGSTISTGIEDALDFAIGFLEEFDWDEFGNSIMEFLEGIDWGGIFGRLGVLILTGIKAGIVNGQKVFAEIASWIADRFRDMGLDTIAGFFDGISEKFKSVGRFVENIFQKIIDLAKEKLGIHSPSKVFAEIGGFVISGLLEGLKNNISTVLEWLKNIPEWFKEKFKQAYAFAKGAFSGIGSWFSDRFTDVKNAFGNVGSWFSEKFKSAYKGVKNAFSGVKKFFSGIWSGIKDAFGNITGWFKDKFSAAWEAVKNVFSKGGKIFDGIKDGILNGLKAVINGLIDGINKVISVPFNGINTALKSLRSVSIAGLKPFDWLPTISVPQIPRLATGAVIPANKEFLAVLGDQKHGTNIEAPLDTIKQAVREELGSLSNQSGSGNIELHLTVECEGYKLLQLIQKLDREQFAKTQRPSFQM